MTPALGIDLGGSKIEALLLDAAGREIWRQRVPTPQGDYAATLQAVAALTAQGRAAASSATDMAMATALRKDRRTDMPSGTGGVSIGIGTPGTPDRGTAQGLMKNCNSTCLNGRPLQADLQALLGQPVALANDANCLAMSEATDGAGAGAEVVFAAILGTGVGAGIAVHGRVLTGPNGLAGEWGHNPLPWDAADGPPPPRWDCYCGQRGCVETLLSGPGLAREHAAHTAHSTLAGAAPLSAADIAQCAAAGDAARADACVDACAASLERHAQRLARALAGVINLLDPDVIVLGGGLSRMPHLYARVPALWGRWVFHGGARDVANNAAHNAAYNAAKGAAPVRTQLRPALHGDASGVRGAAWLGRSAGRQADGH